LPLVYHRFGFFKIKVTVRICRRFGLFKMDVAVPLCRRFALLPFRLSPFGSFKMDVAVLTHPLPKCTRQVRTTLLLEVVDR